ncbi:MAG: xanthine permease [Brevinema sp.]
MPVGPSVPHMFLITFAVIGPVYWSTNDAEFAWKVGLIWAFIEGLIELFGAFFGNAVRKMIPRAVMLGTLAGASLLFISINPALETWQMPYIGFVSLVIILITWVGKSSFLSKIPTALLIIFFGIFMSFIIGHMDIPKITQSFTYFSVNFPVFSFNITSKEILTASTFILSAIPLGLYNFFETMDNLESASTSGDHFNTTITMIGDGVSSIVAALFGAPFPTAVYIGHLGWKNIGAKRGYVLACGTTLLLLTSISVIPILMSIIPLVAIYPILIYIGITITEQAFSHVEQKYYPAVLFALIPWFAARGLQLINSTLNVAGLNPQNIDIALFTASNIPYNGFVILGSGSVLSGMLLSSLVIFIIDHEWLKAVLVSLLLAFFSYVGIIHSLNIKVGALIDITIGYLIIGLFILIKYFHELKKH